MSIPADILDIRRKRHAKTPASHFTAPAPMEDEPLSTVLARITDYEQDAKLAMDLSDDNTHSSDGQYVRPPMRDITERLIDPQSGSKFWQCARCASINLISLGTRCVFCRACS